MLNTIRNKGMKKFNHIVMYVYYYTYIRTAKIFFTLTTAHVGEEV